METKKISFGFSKIEKKTNLVINKQPVKDENKVELIKCLEGQEIKLLVEQKKEEALIIPLKENNKTSAAIASLIKRRAVLLGEEEAEQVTVAESNAPIVEVTNTVTANEEDLDKRAERELLSEVMGQHDDNDGDSNLVLPVVKPDDLILDGAKESTIDDYDAVPVQQFGMAMLRGMGWEEPPKKPGSAVDDAPTVRPKGMGLGADKMLKPKALLIQPEKNEVLEIKKQAFVRILGGKHKDMYGQIEGFDDHAGRIIVRMAIGSCVEVFNEFMCQPVSKKEYAEYGKCINTAKYEAYKKMENKQGQIIIKKEDDKESKYKEDVQKHGSYVGENTKYEETHKHNYDREEIDEKYYKKRDDKYLKKESSHHHERSSRLDDHEYNERNRNARERNDTDQKHASRRRSSSTEFVKSIEKPTSSSRKHDQVTKLRDTSNSSSDNYERKPKKSSKKSKKSKSKSKSRHRDNSSCDKSSDEDKRHRNRNKKSKKSKRKQSRSRSRERK